jgi:hypothetical protein
VKRCLERYLAFCQQPQCPWINAVFHLKDSLGERLFSVAVKDRH